jgi:catechol 2,3-dioxygenase-like lactoylglutathione lyase family enzyme
MRRFALVLAVVLACASFPPPGEASEVWTINVTVSDAYRSRDFFTRVLSFKPISEVEVAGPAYEHLEGIFGLRMRVVTLGLGAEQLSLTQFLTPRGRLFPYDSRSNDRWFQHIAIVVSDMDAAYARLRANHVKYASSAPQTLPAWNPDAAGIKAFYFRDPDGHFLELIQFPPGKGDPRWQHANGRLFLGIDHTAIVVANTDSSIAFYRGHGFRVAGRSENYGNEQEHLNNVFGAHLRITSLRNDGGPGVELLEYLAPRDGRSIPADQRPNDLSFWSVIIDGDAISAPINLPGRKLGFSRAAIITDPDGHHLELTQP